MDKSRRLGAYLIVNFHDCIMGINEIQNKPLNYSMF